ncbi:MAG: HEPN domain-containing protein [Gemmatimonadetes bacterium]|nr:HEPN domain-containing protein [Gemmatimonadota bacterium]
MALDEAARAWVARWVRLAEGDLAMARLGLDSEQFDVYELVGFHAQQAVEKFIKAFLARSAVDFQDQHDIDYLQGVVRKVDSELASKIDPAASLNRYAVGTRYPGRYAPVTRDQAQAAVLLAEQVRADILPLLADAPRPRDSLRERLRQQRGTR